MIVGIASSSAAGRVLELFLAHALLPISSENLTQSFLETTKQPKKENEKCQKTIVHSILMPKKSMSVSRKPDPLLSIPFPLIFIKRYTMQYEEVICQVKGCDRLIGKKGSLGYCSKHYQRYKKHGDPHKSDWRKLKGSNLEEKLRFNSIEDENGCWIWQGARFSNKYGCINVGKRRNRLTHRLAYELWNGEVSSDLFVCHHCDQPLCVNPNHLFLGTDQDNMNDKVKKGRGNCGRGENQGSSILTEKEVQQIKYFCLVKEMSQRKIARLYKVSPQGINDIIKGINWKHVKCPNKFPRKVNRKKLNNFIPIS